MRKAVQITMNPRLTYAIQSFDETGAMRAPYQICKGFLAAGWDVEIATTASASNAAIDTLWDRVPVWKVDGPSKKARLLRLAAAFIQRRRRNIVLTWVWDWHCFGLLAARILFGSPYAVVLDTYTHRASGTVLEKARQELRYGLVLRNASVILAEVPNAYEHARRHTRKPEVLLVPACLWHAELQMIEAGWERAQFQPQREPVILYTGRLVERKNIHVLINAFVRLAGRFPEWTLELYGPATSPGYAAMLRDLAAASPFADRIKFQPSLSGDLLYRRYRATAIYALPSEGEGFPTTILEAMYFNGAIVAGKSGYVDYQLGNGTCGLLHTPGDVDTLTEHLALLMSSEQAQASYRAAARARLIDLFTWERYFGRVERTFRSQIEPAAA